MTEPERATQVSAKGPLPLLIGVVGHRDLRPKDIGELTRLVNEFFLAVEVQCSATPIRLLSPLAEGTDQLVARIALERGAELVAVLPMEQALYEEDFPPTVLAQFRDLKNRATQTITLPVARGATEDSIAQAGPDRDRQYEQAGIFVVHHAQILLALWDGEETNLTGGTSSIVNFQTHGIPPDAELPGVPPRELLDEPGTGPCYIVSTPRDRAGHATRFVAFSTRMTLPEGPKRIRTRKRLNFRERAEQIERGPRGLDSPAIGELSRAITSICHPLNGFNRDVLDQKGVIDQQGPTSEADLLPNAQAGGLTPTLARLRTRFALADTLAIRFQSNLNETVIAIYVLVFISAFAFASFSHLLTRWWVLGGYVAVTGLTSIVYGMSRWHEAQNKHQDYRALAEGLRVQFHWWLSGQMLSVADYYLRKQKGELDWIRNAIRAWSMQGLSHVSLPQSLLDSSSRLARIKVAYDAWIQHQAGYFTERIERENERLEWIEVIAGIGFAVGMLTAIGLTVALATSHGAEEFLKANHSWEGTISLLMSMPVVIAALLHSYSEKKALSEHIKQYRRMAELYARAAKYLKPLIENPAHQVTDTELDSAENLLKQLGIEALAESADWLILHRERPVNPPHAT